VTSALCFSCGTIKFGALCPCADCGAEAEASSRFAIVFSDHHLHVDALRRFGRIIVDLRTAFPNASERERRVALDLFLREHMPERFHPDTKDESPAAIASARAMLERVELPKITMSSGPPSPTGISMSIADRARAWAIVEEEVARCPALRLTNRRPSPDEPDARISDLEKPIVLLDGEPEVVVVERRVDGSALSEGDIARARHIVRCLAFRRETIEMRLASIVAAQREALEAPAPILPIDARRIPRAAELHESTWARLGSLRLRYGTREIRIDELVAIPHAASRPSTEELARIKARIAALVADEDKTKPLSDLRIVELLATENVVVPRRTIATCREELGIPSSSRRRLG
jgi:hypothetical protein